MQKGFSNLGEGGAISSPKYYDRLKAYEKCSMLVY